MKEKKIDILMGVYNCDKYIEDSIECLLKQSFDMWNLIVCDDGSTDGTYKIVEKYAKKYKDKILLLKNDKNMGLNYTLNKCLENATAKYVARMDGDDVCHPERLKKEYDFLENNKEYSFVSSNMILFDENGEWGNVRNPEKPTKYDFLKGSPFCHASVMIKRDAMLSVGGYTISEKLLRVEDYHLWFKLYEKGYIGYNIQEYLYSMRDDQNAIKRRNWKNRKNEYYVRKIGYNMLNIPFYLRFFKYRPLILGIIPQNLYRYLHRSRLKNNMKNKKIRVLEVIGSMNMGGAETLLMNVLRNINREKFDLYFLCYGNNKFDYEEEVNKLGGHIIRIDKINIKNFYKYIKILKNIIKNNNIDVVHAHTYYNSMFSIIAAKKCKIKNIITHSHNTLSEPNPSLFKRLYFKISKRIINNYSTIFLACGKEAGEALFYKNNKYIIIDNGIILEDFFYNKAARNKKRKELKMDEKTTVLGHVGRFDEVKNHSFIIEIIKKYVSINPQTKLVLIGDGILKKEIEQKVKDYNLDDKVLFLGKRKDVKELYSAMDLLLFPSLFEGLPVTLIEAQTNGLPILASSTIDKDVNISKHIVFKDLNDSADDWANQINDLINKRYDCQDLLLDSIYNMKKNIYKLEKIYENQ